MHDFPTQKSSHTQVRYTGRNYSNATLLNIVGIIADVIGRYSSWYIAPVWESLSNNLEMFLSLTLGSFTIIFLTFKPDFNMHQVDSVQISHFNGFKFFRILLYTRM